MRRKTSKENKQPTSNNRLVVVIVGLVAVIIASSFVDYHAVLESFTTVDQNQSLQKNDDPTSKDARAANMDELNKLALRKQPPKILNGLINISYRKLPVMRWVNGSSLSNAVKIGKPTTFKHKDIMSWSIFDLNLLQLSETVRLQLNGTRWQPEPVFVLGQERERGGMLGSPKDHPLSYTNVTLSQFVVATFDERNWLYWTGELAYWEAAINATQSAPTGATNGSFNDWRDFRIKEQGLAWESNTTNSNSSTTEIEDKDDVWRPMVWLSHPGVVAQTHYDTQHNVFVQVLGSKRFFLFAPKTELYAYPNIHRSYRQSQVHLETSSREQFPLVSPTNTTAYEVVLNPGDVLYIPPYWHHRVESLTLAVSLSILSPSYVEASLAEVFWENVPFGAFQAKRGQRTRAVRLYLSRLVEEVATFTSNATLQEFAQQVYATRFATLKTQSKQFPTCFEHDQESGQVDSDAATPGTAQAMDALLEVHSAKFHSAARNVGSMLLRIDADSAIKITFLRDYIEQLSRWAVGPDYTGSYIQHCLV